MKILETCYRTLRNWKRRLRLSTKWPPIGAIDWGDLRRVKPISQVFGKDRGNSIARYYIEKFLQLHEMDIKGRVLEIGDARYTLRFGGEHVVKSDVLHVNLNKPGVTIVADLSNADDIPSDIFDYLIITEALQRIYSVVAAVKTGYRILRPGGVLLATFPGICKIAHPESTES